MDLRNKNLSTENLKQVKQFILQGKLAYQPFIFSDTLEVGEGQRFHDGEDAEGNGDIYWQDVDQGIWEKLRVKLHPKLQASFVADLDHFRECNRQLRLVYEHFLDTLVEQLGNDISDLTFAEIGCNSGYFMNGLALRKAKECIGYDYTDHSEVFKWFNRVLGTNTIFHQAEWDSFTHSLKYAELPEVDVTLSVAVTCHLADPIHHLAYLCDHARKAVFFWVPVVYSGDELSMSFGRPSKYSRALDWPSNLDNDIRLSVPLLRMCLEQAGFEKIIEVEPPGNISDTWKGWFSSQKGYIAFRTRNSKTAIFGGRKSRELNIHQG